MPGGRFASAAVKLHVNAANFRYAEQRARIGESVAEAVQSATKTAQPASSPALRHGTVLWLQAVTLTWMALECGIALTSAVKAHSAALLAFGADSTVELLSAGVVLLQYVPGFALGARRARSMAAALLFTLAAIVVVSVGTGSLFSVRAETSRAGLAITIAALLVMPVLAWLKRREARRVGDAALAADAMQSATCAYLALLTLSGLAANALMHIAWLDSAAALLAVPLLVREGRATLRGQGCSCG